MAEPPSAADRIGFAGVADVRIGMQLWQLLDTLGQKATVEAVDNDCTYVVPANEPLGLSYMIISGELARIDVVRPGISTISGVQVGNSEAEVKAAYDDHVDITDHQYVDGHYLTVKSTDGHSAVVFETDGTVVTSFRIGRLPEAQYIEGCS